MIARELLVVRLTPIPVAFPLAQRASGKSIQVHCSLGAVMGCPAAVVVVCPPLPPLPAAPVAAPPEQAASETIPRSPRREERSPTMEGLVPQPRQVVPLPASGWRQVALPGDFAAP